MSVAGGMPDPLPIEPAAGPVDASIRVPGSKSLSNRHLVLAALADEPTRLRGLLACDDCDRLLAALDAVGARHRIGSDAVIVEPVREGAAPSNARVDLGDGGTPTRFMIALAAVLAGTTTTIDGSARMRERPVAEGIELLRALGARVEYVEADGRLPVRVHGGTLRGGSIEVGRTASSQFISALMLVAARTPDGIEIRFAEEPTSGSYIELSLAALAAARVDARVAHRPVLLAATNHGTGIASIAIAPQRIGGGAVDIEPDASSAVYPAAAAVLTGGTVVLDGLPRRSLQPDSFFLDDLALRGARIEPIQRGRGSSAHDLATRVSAGAALRGVDSDYGRAPDSAVMAMVLAACGDRPSRFSGLGTLRVKESDRIASVAAGLRALGAEVETGADWAVVNPLPKAVRPAVVDSANDHRIAMAFAVLGLARPGVSMSNPACVAKSWPGFWSSLDLLRGRS